MTKISTHYKDPKRAAMNLVEKINNDEMVKELGDKALYFEQNGVHCIGLDFAFEAAISFTNGDGIYGSEGYGPCGPTFDQEHSSVFLEPLESVIIGVYRD